MQITKRRLQEITKEEMDHLAETGYFEALSESEKMTFQIILVKLSPEEVQAAKERELSFLDEFQVYKWVSRDDVPYGNPIYDTD